MNLDRITGRMEQNGLVVRALLAGVDDDQARWKPSDDDWSLLEVINHLYDEEREDFRTRVDILLHRPAEPWPPIEPGRWVTARRYAARVLVASVDNFLQERAISLAWLRSLTAPDWNQGFEHPVVGRLTAGDIMASWLAHDFLHIRQINELHYGYHMERAAPYRVDYAGEW